MVGFETKLLIKRHTGKDNSARNGSNFSQTILPSMLESGKLRLVSARESENKNKFGCIEEFPYPDENES